VGTLVGGLLVVGDFVVGALVGLAVNSAELSADVHSDPVH